MNKQRRKAINKIIEELENIQTTFDAELREALEEVRQEEEEALENLPESLQESEKGERMQSAIDLLNDSDYELSSVVDSIQTLIDYLNEAMEV